MSNTIISAEENVIHEPYWDEDTVWEYIFKKYHRNYDFEFQNEACIIECRSLIDVSDSFAIMMVPNVPEIINETIDLLCQKCSYDKSFCHTRTYKKPGEVFNFVKQDIEDKWLEK